MQQSNDLKLRLTPSIINRECVANGVEVWSIKRGYMFYNTATNQTEKFDPPQYKMLGLYEKIDESDELAQSGRAYMVTVADPKTFEFRKMYFKKIKEELE
jgi:hypothetical protein